jgi:hypothetical protein
MRLIDYDKLYHAVMDAALSSTDEDVIFDLMDSSAVDAVSLSELTALRDTLYDMDAITFRGLAKINQLIAKYGGQGISTPG